MDKDANLDILEFLFSRLHETGVLGHLIKAYEIISPNVDLKARLEARMKLGLERYGHGIRLTDDTRQWGTREDSWMEMCEEEILDGIIYAVAHQLRTQ